MRNCVLPTIVEIGHLLIKTLSKVQTAVDMTVGNGHDLLYLAELFPQVYGFDIQMEAITHVRKKVTTTNVTLINDDHYNFDNYLQKADLFVFNLGWLPHSDKKISTDADHTIMTLTKCKQHLNPQGVICITCYNGDTEQRKESQAVDDWIHSETDFFVQKVTLPKAKNGPILYLLALKSPD